jgi:hypothetical protein
MGGLIGTLTVSEIAAVKLAENLSSDAFRLTLLRPAN